MISAEVAHLRELPDAQSPGQLVGSRIETIRKRHGWTQQQLSHELAAWGGGAKFDRSTIAKIEAGG